jgi:hypothetical protein
VRGFASPRHWDETKTTACPPPAAAEWAVNERSSSQNRPQRPETLRLRSSRGCPRTDRRRRPADGVPGVGRHWSPVRPTVRGTITRAEGTRTGAASGDTTPPDDRSGTARTRNPPRSETMSGRERTRLDNRLVIPTGPDRPR